MTLSLPDLRQHVVKVSQFPLFIVDSVRANLQLGKAAADDAELEAACRRTGLWEILAEKVGLSGSPFDYPVHIDKFSGGERKIFSLTRSLLLKPRILLIDEPTTGLDPWGRAVLPALLRKVCKDITVLVVDHDMPFVAQFADQVCLLDNGKFVEAGTPEELAQKPGLCRSFLQPAQEPEPQPTAEVGAALAEPSSPGTGIVGAESLSRQTPAEGFSHQRDEDPDRLSATERKDR